MPASVVLKGFLRTDILALHQRAKINVLLQLFGDKVKTAVKFFFVQKVMFTEREEQVWAAEKSKINKKRRLESVICEAMTAHNFSDLVSSITSMHLTKRGRDLQNLYSLLVFNDVLELNPPDLYFF